MELCEATQAMNWPRRWEARVPIQRGGPGYLEHFCNVRAAQYRALHDFYAVGETFKRRQNACLWLLLQQKVGLKSINGRYLHH